MEISFFNQWRDAWTFEIISISIYNSPECFDVDLTLLGLGIAFETNKRNKK